VCVAEEAPSPRVVGSPARWPALFAAWGWKALASGPAVSSSPKGGRLHRPGLLRLPPPSCGRLGEFDGGHFLDGASEALSPVLPVQQGACCWFFLNRVWCWELWFSGIYSPADECRPNTKVLRRPICKPMNDSGNETSMVRPSSRSHPAFIISSEASGLVPAPVLDGGDYDLSLDGGEREGSDCYQKSFSEVLSTITRDLCVISIFLGSFVKNVLPPLISNVKLPGPSGHPLLKKMTLSHPMDGCMTRRGLIILL
jgi:hypothetical protein